jgi:hypothetical protein
MAGAAAVKPPAPRGAAENDSGPLIGHLHRARGERELLGDDAAERSKHPLAILDGQDVPELF